MKEPRLSVCLSFDFDAMSSWIGTFKTTSLPAISRGEYGAHVLPRILEMLRRQEVTTTFFVPGHTALAFPAAVKAIAEDGHEIGHHGWVHENPAELDPATELEVLEKGFAALEKVAGVRPRGYRSPGCDFSEATPDLLREHGFLYDSSCSASDFTPYYLRKGDRFSLTEPYRFGDLTDMVEMPFFWTMDDFPHFEFVAGFSTAQSTPAHVRELWQGEFDWAVENVPGGVYDLCMHPQAIGRGSRLAMLEGLIEHMKTQPGVVFETMLTYAERWKAANPIERWRSENPARVGSGSHGEL
jgi:peptidoglycan/xylan/chitin deacetylase (PgdA/CDA1 family)